MNASGRKKAGRTLTRAAAGTMGTGPTKRASTRRPAETLTEAEVEKLLASCSRRGSAGKRMRAMIELMYGTGLRMSEALSLEFRDLDPDKGTVLIRHGKGDQSRVVGMPDRAWTALELWLATRDGKLGLRRTGPVFCKLGGGPLDDRAVRAAFTRLGQKAGLQKRIHAHGLRHTITREMVDEGLSLRVIQAMLGHRSIATTARYVGRIAPAEVVNAMRNR